MGLTVLTELTELTVPMAVVIKPPSPHCRRSLLIYKRNLITSNTTILAIPAPAVGSYFMSRIMAATA